MREYRRRFENFYVPSAFIKQFALLMQKYKIENILAGLEGDDLIFFVDYDVSKQSVIDLIQIKIEKFKAVQKNDKWRLNGIKGKRNV